MATDNSTLRPEDQATRLLVALGAMVVMAAAIALIVAGVHLADAFAPGASAVAIARDRGIGAATPMWATPLALPGLAATFSGIAFALTRVRHDIRGRRDALVTALPAALSAGR
jgi:hypothetical protein